MVPRCSSWTTLANSSAAEADRLSINPISFPENLLPAVCAKLALG